MTTARDKHLENVAEIRLALSRMLDEMQDCLDWRPNPDSWTAREVFTHMLYTPPGGVPQVLNGLLAGTIQEYDLWADQKYMSEEARAWTMEEVRKQFDHYFDALEQTLLTLTDSVLEETSGLVHQRNRHWDEPRAAQWLVERLFAGHWREHLVQLEELKQAAPG